MNNYKTDHTILYYDLRDLTNFEIWAVFKYYENLYRKNQWVNL